MCGGDISEVTILIEIGFKKLTVCNKIKTMIANLLYQYLKVRSRFFI